MVSEILNLPNFVRINVFVSLFHLDSVFWVFNLMNMGPRVCLVLFLFFTSVVLGDGFHGVYAHVFARERACVWVGVCVRARAESRSNVRHSYCLSCSSFSFLGCCCSFPSSSYCYLFLLLLLLLLLLLFFFFLFFFFLFFFFLLLLLLFFYSSSSSSSF